MGLQLPEIIGPNGRRNNFRYDPLVFSTLTICKVLFASHSSTMLIATLFSDVFC